MISVAANGGICATRVICNLLVNIINLAYCLFHFLSIFQSCILKYSVILRIRLLLNFYRRSQSCPSALWARDSNKKYSDIKFKTR